MTEITAAGQSRGSEFGKVMRSPLFWGPAVMVSILAGFAAGLYFNPAAGAAAFIAAFLFVLVCGFAYANAMAAESFHDKDNPSTVVVIDVPATAARLPELIVHRRDGNRALDSVEDRFRDEHQRVKLESEALDERFEIFTAKGQDENFVRQVFSPSFIVWLNDSSPKEFAFELAGGHLVASVPGYRDTTAGFDEMISAGTAVAARLRQESTE